MRLPWLSLPRSPLPILLLIVTLPVVVASLLYMLGWQPERSRGHGDFLRPPPILSGVTLSSQTSPSISLGNLNGSWVLFYVMPERCGEPCNAALYGLRMAHLAQGKESARVLRVALAATPAQASLLARNDPEMLALTASPAQRAFLLEKLREEASSGTHIYIIDPMGNAILRYPDATDPQGIRQDINHLLKHSWVG